VVSLICTHFLTGYYVKGQSHEIFDVFTCNFIASPGSIRGTLLYEFGRILTTLFEFKVDSPVLGRYLGAPLSHNSVVLVTPQSQDYAVSQSPWNHAFFILENSEVLETLRIHDSAESQAPQSGNYMVL